MLFQHNFADLNLKKLYIKVCQGALFDSGLLVREANGCLIVSR